MKKRVRDLRRDIDRFRFQIDVRVALREIGWTTFSSDKHFYSRIDRWRWTSEAVLEVVRRSYLQHRSENAPPSQRAVFLLRLFLSKKDRDTLVDDLVEEYEDLILPEHGPKQARFWFWWQVIHSIAPVVLRRFAKLIPLVALTKAASWVSQRLGG